MSFSNVFSAQRHNRYLKKLIITASNNVSLRVCVSAWTV